VPELWEFSSLPFLSGQEEVKQPEGNITTDIPVSGGDYIYEGTGEILSGSWTEAPLSGTALTGTTTS
jgi:hypothetical protein